MSIKLWEYLSLSSSSIHGTAQQPTTAAFVGFEFVHYGWKQMSREVLCSPAHPPLSAGDKKGEGERERERERERGENGYRFTLYSSVQKRRVPPPPPPPQIDRSLIAAPALNCGCCIPDQKPDKCEMGRTEKERGEKCVDPTCVLTNSNEWRDFSRAREIHIWDRDGKIVVF
jgi:hypothetical protein